MIGVNLKASGIAPTTITAGARQSPAAVTLGGSISRNSWWHRQSIRFRRDAKEVLHQTRVLMLLLTHPGAPLRTRAVAGCAALYLVSPIQLIPSFIPIIGQLDDLFVLWAGMKLARRFTSHDVLEECEAHAKCGRFFSARSEKPHCVQAGTAMPLTNDP
jgi:uncharacterized membrane protein YkvA (DUF1232 family)